MRGGKGKMRKLVETVEVWEWAVQKGIHVQGNIVFFVLFSFHTACHPFWTLNSTEWQREKPSSKYISAS